MNVTKESSASDELIVYLGPWLQGRFINPRVQPGNEAIKERTLRQCSTIKLPVRTCDKQVNRTVR